jgi:RNA polymerase sigma factor (TIGR02999 family)
MEMVTPGWLEIPPTVSTIGMASLTTIQTLLAAFASQAPHAPKPHVPPVRKFTLLATRALAATPLAFENQSHVSVKFLRQPYKRLVRENGIRYTGKIMTSPGARVDLLLERWSGGDRAALEELAPLVYGELHAIAARYRRAESQPPSLQTTELLHEAFLRLVEADRVWWTNRAQFFALAARVIRNILVDAARRRKRREPQSSDEAERALEHLAGSVPAGMDVEMLDLALIKLEQLDPMKARIVDLRFFGGLSVEETAELMSIGTATVKRHWAVARVWLFREIQGELPE